MKPQTEKPNLQVSLTSPLKTQFDANSASSRYLPSTKELNDNIPDWKYKKSSPKKVYDKLFDTKIM